MRDADTHRPEVKNLTIMASSLFSSVFTAGFNNMMARQNARESMAWQERMMDKQNAYNSPLNQLLLKRAAGVNPYAETGFTPSAGVSGVKADTIPMNDPLQYAKTFAEIENLNAATNKTETETDKLLKDISMLDLAYSKGLLEKDEYEKRLQMMFEAWEKRNPYEVELDNVESGTTKNLAEAGLADEQADTQQYIRDNLSSQTNLNEAEANYKTALEAYQQIINSNADKEQKSKIALNYAVALANRATASAQRELANKYRVEQDLLDEQAYHTMKEEERAAALFEFDKAIKQYARDMHMDQATIVALERQWQEYINQIDKDGSFTFPSMLAKFVYGNVSAFFGGSTSFTKNSK